MSASIALEASPTASEPKIVDDLDQLERLLDNLDIADLIQHEKVQHDWYGVEKYEAISPKMLSDWLEDERSETTHAGMPGALNVKSEFRGFLSSRELAGILEERFTEFMNDYAIEYDLFGDEFEIDYKEEVIPDFFIAAQEALDERYGEGVYELEIEPDAGLDEFIKDHVYVDPNMGVAADALELDVDLFLMEGDEASADFSRSWLLGRIVNGESRMDDPGREDALKNCALAWIAEQRGADRSEILEASDPSSKVHDLWFDLLNYSGGLNALTVPVRCDLGSFCDLLAAKVSGSGLYVQGEVSCGLYDFMNGGGSADFDVTMDKGLHIPSDMIFDVTIEPSKYGETTVSAFRDGGDWAIKTVLECDDSLWARNGSLKSYSIPAPEDRRYSPSTDIELAAMSQEKREAPDAEREPDLERGE